MSQELRNQTPQQHEIETSSEVETQEAGSNQMPLGQLNITETIREIHIEQKNTPDKPGWSLYDFATKGRQIPASRKKKRF